MRWILVALGLLLAAPAQAQEPETGPLVAAPAPADGRIVDVRVRGNRRIEDATVLTSVRMRSGMELTSEQVRQDLKSVYATGFFEDVIVETEQVDGGVIVTFVVDEKPAIVEVRIEGQDKVDEEDIREVVNLRPFSVLNQRDLQSNVDRVRDLYVEKGFYLADVEPVVVPAGDDRVDVVLRIQENKKVLVQKVEFTGNDNLPDAKIKRFLQTKEGGVLPWLTGSGTFRREALEGDRETIRFVFLEEGFVDVQVDEPNVYLSPDKRFIFVSFNIDEGPRYAVDKIEVTGDFDPDEGLSKETVLEVVRGRPVAEVEEEQWREAQGLDPRLRLGDAEGPRLEPGEVFKLSTLQQVVGQITALYADKGYAFVNVVPLPYTDPETEKVDITFQIDRGEKVRIGRITITGNDPTLDKVVRRELQIDEGELYHHTRIQASRTRLERLGYFDEVAITTPRGEGENVVDLNVRVSEQPTGSFSLGLGYSNLENLVLTGSVSKNNFLGLGYNFSGMINWSSVRKQFNASLFDPYFLDTRWTFSINGYNITRQFQLNEFQRGGSLGIGRYLDPRDDVRLSFQYTIEDVGLTSLDPYKRRVLGGELFRNGLTSSVETSLVVDKRNNRILPTKGFYASASAELAGGFRVGDDTVLNLLGGEFNFVETRANLRFYQPIIPDRPDLLVFRVNSSLGQIWSTDGQIVPFIHRFRAGGINSVRGFNWFSLGPTIRAPASDDPVRADESIVVGGTGSFINNFEVQFPIVKQAGVSGVVFFDAGNAFGDPWGDGGISISGLRTSYGAGVRWQSPLGPLRFEWGFPTNPLEGEKKSVFDFSIGSFF